MTLGEIIHQYREKHSMSMDAFSQKSGLSKSYISLLEKNEHPTTKAEIAPSLDSIHKAAIGMNMDFDDLLRKIEGNVSLKPDNYENRLTSSLFVRIPVYGSVSAGSGCFADGNIEDYVDIPEDMAKHGEYFGLRVKGDSMEPDIKDGDTVIVRKTEDIPSDGKTVIAIVNGDEGVCKRLYKYAEGLCLSSNNSNYSPRNFTAQQVRSLPVQIVGVVERLIRDF